MANMKTSIEWCDVTWSPVRGCRRVSPGCERCYAEVAAHNVNRRIGGDAPPYHGLVELRGGRPRWTGEARLVPEVLAKPLSWRRSPGRVFVDSMSDLFYEGFSDREIAAVFGVMASSRGTFLILTKRAARAAAWFRWLAESPTHPAATCRIEARSTLVRAGLGVAAAKLDRPGVDAWPLPNVWIGVSTEDQQRADERIPHLLQIPAAVRFLSCEPLLGRVEITKHGIDGIRRRWLGACECDVEANEGAGFHHRDCPAARPRVDWVIAGCESGPGARAAHPDWYRHLRDQCAAAGVPFYLKQAMAAASHRRGYPSSQAAVVTTHEVHDEPPGPMLIGKGAHRGRDGVISLPFLDGVQHTATPK